MKTTEYECLECGGNSMLRYPSGTIKCLDCGHHFVPSRTIWKQPSPAPEITVSRYRKADGYPTRHYAIHLDGILLAVTVYRKGAETVKKKLLELLDGKTPSPAQRADFVRACGGPVSIELARENGFFKGC